MFTTTKEKESAMAKIFKSSLSDHNEDNSLGPPWKVGIIQVVICLIVIQVTVRLIPIWDVAIWVIVGLPLAAGVHRYNKYRYGAATRKPVWKQ